ncbi:MAG: transcription initiation protein [Alphaproteobacteria bacterium]|nr:transcription initiation protein [Alphaproteobacteria bacterium]
MAQFMMLLNVSGQAPEGSPEEMQEILKRYGDWSRKLAESGKLVNGTKLAGDRGRLLRNEGSRVVVDGPFSETKEMVGGFFIVEAENYDAAAEVAKTCPHLALGGTIELRQVDDM